MRNRRLLTLAVLAVALGFAAFAQAETAVVIVTTNGGGNWDITYQLNDGASLGTASTSLGASDFTLRSIIGTGDVTVQAGAAIDTSVMAGAVTNGGTPVTAGFAGGIHKLEYTAATSEYNLVLSQPLAYAATAGEQSLLKDAAVLLGIGSTGSPADLQSRFLTAGISFDGGAPAYNANTAMVAGTYSTTGQGAVTAYTYGITGFSVVPVDGNLAEPGFTGPSLATGSFGTPVSAVVVKTVDAVAGTTDVRVEAGTVALGAGFTGNKTTSLTLLDGENAAVTIAGGTNGALKTFSAVNMNTAADGNQLIDLASPTTSGKYNGIKIYAGDLNALANAEQAVIALVATGVSSSGIEGIVDTGLASHPNMVLAMTDQTSDVDGGYVLVRPTILGDANLDGKTDFSDVLILANFNNWQVATGATWDMGDFTGDGAVDFSDVLVMANFANWQQNYSPEPATMALLALGAFGLVSRRRRK